MKKLRIEVHGSGMDSNCVGMFSRYSNLVRKWGYGDDVELDYVIDNELNQCAAFVVVKQDEEKVKKWEGIPAPSEFKDYLKGVLGEPATAGASSKCTTFSKSPLPW